MYLKKISTGLTVTALLTARASTHFLLNYPNTIGFDDDNEGKGPCGGFDVTFDNSSDFHVGGDAIALQSTHPQADWLFRATLDKTATGNNWTDFLPVVSQSGLGAYCEPFLTVPDVWSGSSGIIQVIQDAADGALYQCAAVNFVAGKATSTPPSCKNATGLTAAFTTNADLPTAAATGGPSGSASMTGMTGMTSATAASTPQPSTANSAATSMHQHIMMEPLLWSGLAVAGLTTAFMGALYL